MLPRWSFADGIFDFSEGSPQRISSGRLFGIVADQICGQIHLGPQLAVPTEALLSRPSGDCYLAQDPNAVVSDLISACVVELDPEFANAALELVLDGVAELGQLGFLVQRGRHRHAPTLLETDLVSWRPRSREAWSCELKTTVQGDLRYSSRLRTSNLRSQLQSEGRWSGQVILVAYLDWLAGAAKPASWRFAAECIGIGHFCNASLDEAWVSLIGQPSLQYAAPFDLDSRLQRAGQVLTQQLQAGSGKLTAPRDKSAVEVAAGHSMLLYRAAILHGVARQEAIAKVLCEGESALLRRSADDAVIALCTACALLSAPRRMNESVSDRSAVPTAACASRGDEDRAPDCQPKLRALVVKLLSAFDLRSDGEYLREPLGCLNQLLKQVDLDHAARANEWRSIEDALGRNTRGPSFVEIGMKRARVGGGGGDSGAGPRERRRLQRVVELEQPGSWRVCN